MIGLVVAAHKKLGVEMLEAAQGIVGPIEGAAAIEFQYDVDPEKTAAVLEAKVKELDDGDGVLILTDMFGGTPTNVSLSLLQRDNVEVIAGVNLPMLIKAQAARWQMNLAELTVFLHNYGARNIIVAGDIFRSKPVKEG